MIIFTTLQDIPVEFLEYKRIRQVVKYNLSSYYSSAQTLNYLIPSSQYVSEDVLQGDCITPEFDIAYHNYILGDNNAFSQFMNIMIPAYMSPDVLVQIMIMRSPYSDAITESLLKLIQQRYGYNAYIVNELDDFLYVEESDMSVPGLFMIDQDIQRWNAINPNGGEIYE